MCSTVSVLKIAMLLINNKMQTFYSNVYSCKPYRGERERERDDDKKQRKCILGVLNFLLLLFFAACQMRRVLDTGSRGGRNFTAMSQAQDSKCRIMRLAHIPKKEMKKRSLFVISLLDISSTIFIALESTVHNLNSTSSPICTVGRFFLLHTQQEKNQSQKRASEKPQALTKQGPPKRILFDLFQNCT